MGIFSGKTTVYVGVTNSRLYQTEDIPNSIKDSTAGYLKDIGEGKNNGIYMTDYNRLAIESSLVMNIKNAYRFSNKDVNNYIKYDSRYTSVINPELIDIDLYNKILLKVHAYYPEATINYFSYKYLDMAHIVKVALDKDYNWNSYNNTMSFNGLNGWLYSVDISLTNLQEEPSFGNSFASGETATRVRDTTKPFKPFIYEGVTEDKFLIKFMPRYIKTITKTNRVYKDKTTDEVTLEEEDIVTNTDDKPIDETSTIYESINTQENINVYDDPNDSNIEITETITDITELSYGTIKQKTKYFKEYMSILPANLPEIDGPSETPELSQSLIDYIAGVNAGETFVDNLDGKLVVFLSLRIDSNTNKHFTISDSSEGGIEGSIAEGLKELIHSENVSGFIPAVHLKIKDNILDKEDEEWRTNYLYAKKLGIKLKGLYEKITEEMKNDEKKIRHAYIQFGVNIESKNKLEIKYMFDYFLKELNGNDKSDAKHIDLKTSSTRESISWDSIGKNTVTKTIDTEYQNDTVVIRLPIGNKLLTIISLLKRISETECESITVLGYERVCRISNNMFKGKIAEASEGSFVLLPLNYEVMKDSIKGFKNKENFLYRCMYIEFLTYIKVKQKWYQTGIFKIATIIISAAIIFFSGGSGSYLSALLLSTVTAFATELIIKIAVNVLGAKAAKYVAIAIALIGLGRGIGAGLASSAASVTKMLTAFLMNAKTLITIANQLLNQSAQVLGRERQEEMEEKNRDLKAFKEQTEVLLGSRINDVDYLENRSYISEYITFGSIEDITNQFLDLNKIDTCVQYIHNYVEYLISVPTLDDAALSILGKS